MRTGQFAPDLKTLIDNRMIERWRVETRGYKVKLRCQSWDKYEAVAEPIAPKDSGIRYFLIDETGVITYEEMKPATKSSYRLGE